MAAAFPGPTAEEAAGRGHGVSQGHRLRPELAKAMKAREAFSQRYGSRHPKAVETLGDDWDPMVTFYGFPESHWKHLKTTNIVESSFASVRVRTSAGVKIVVA